MEDNKALEVQEEIKDNQSIAFEQSVEEIKSNNKQNKKEEINKIKEEKTIYEVVLVFNDYRNRLVDYTEENGRVICGKFLNENKAKIEAQKLLDEGILVEIKSK